MQSAPWKTLRSSPINSTVCVGRLLWILLCWIWRVPVAWHWEGDGHGAPSCVVVCRVKKNSVTRWWVCSTKLSRKCVLPLYCHCHGNYAASSISDQNWIKNRDPQRKSIRFTWNPKAWLANEPANEWIPIFGLFLFVSLSLQHGSAWCLSIPCWLANPSFLQYLDGSFQWSQTLQKQASEKHPPTKFEWFDRISYIFLKSFWISLPINAKKTLWGNASFLRFACLCISLWSLTVEVSFIFIDLSRFSTVDVPPSGPENVPKPGRNPPKTGHHCLLFRVPAEK